MAPRRKHIDRTLKSPYLVEKDKIVDMPAGWEFSISCTDSGKTYHFDFIRYGNNGREPLAAQFRDAIWSMRREKAAYSLYGYFTIGMSFFWRFLDSSENSADRVTHLEQIDDSTIIKFLAWSALQISTRGKNKGKPLSVGGRKTRYQYIKTLLINRSKRVPDSVNPKLSFPINPFLMSLKSNSQDNLIQVVNKIASSKPVKLIWII